MEFDIELQADGARGRYTAAMPDGTVAHLTFSRAGAGRIVADSTFVPPAFRGRGIAEALVARLVADARAAGDRIAPSCWFVADEFARHSPDWDDLRA